jgi:ketosteroid isomerase-like protein
MRLTPKRLLAGLVIAAATACSSPATTPQTDANTAAAETTIRAGTATWNDAYNAGEVDKIVALYTDDTVVMPPNVPAIVGRDALKAYLVKDMAAARAAGLIAKDGTSSVGVSGDLAWHAGSSSVVDASGKTVETGSYVEVWRRTNGQWLMVRDIWNDDAPPTAAAASTPGS